MAHAKTAGACGATCSSIWVVVLAAPISPAGLPGHADGVRMGRAATPLAGSAAAAVRRALLAARATLIMGDGASVAQRGVSVTVFAAVTLRMLHVALVPCRPRVRLWRSASGGLRHACSGGCRTRGRCATT